MACLQSPDIHVDGDELWFFAIGDWGANERPTRTLAQAMSDFAATHPPAFILSLGDNFYPQGVHSTKDLQFQVRLEAVAVARVVALLVTSSYQRPLFIWAGCVGERVFEAVPEASRAVEGGAGQPRLRGRPRSSGGVHDVG
jgi:hypothetical protein